MREQYKIMGFLMMLFLLSTAPLWAQHDWEAASQHAVLRADWPQVAEKAREWQRQEPGEVVASWLIGYADLATEKYQAATERFRQLGKSQSLSRLERWSAALVANHPRNATAHMLYGDALARVGNYVSALGPLDEAVRISPRSAFVHNVRGVVRTFADRPDDARKDFETAIALSPRFADAHANYGLLYLTKGLPGQATTHFSNALKYAPDFALARNGRGLAFLSLQDYGGAVADLAHARRDFGAASPQWLTLNQHTALRENARWGLSQHLAQIDSSDKGQARPMAFNFDTKGRLTGLTDVFNQQTQYHYDSTDHLSRVMYPTGQKAEYHYNADGLLHVVHTEQGQRLQYTYGPRQEWMRVQFPNGDTLRLEQNTQGRHTTIRYPDGEAVHYQYDTRDRLTQVQTSQATGTMSYNAEGHLQKVTWSDGRVAQFRYDTDNRLQRLVGQDGREIDHWESTLDADAQGRIARLTDPLGRMQMQWDKAGRLRSAASDWGWKAKIHWDQDGKHPRSMTTSWGYVEFDDKGRPADVYTLQGLRVLATWDDGGHLGRIMTPFGGTMQMRYDDMARQATIRFPHGLDTTLRWNQHQRLIQVQDVRGMTSFQRDATGRLQRLRSGALHMQLRPLSSVRVAQRSARRYRYAMPPIHASRMLPSRHGRFWSRVQGLIEQSNQLPLPITAQRDAYWTQEHYKQNDPYYREFIADVENFAAEMPDLDAGQVLKQQVLVTGVLATHMAQLGLTLGSQGNKWIGLLVSKLPGFLRRPMRSHVNRYSGEILDDVGKARQFVETVSSVSKDIFDLSKHTQYRSWTDLVLQDKRQPQRIMTIFSPEISRKAPPRYSARVLLQIPRSAIEVSGKAMVKDLAGSVVRNFGVSPTIDAVVEYKQPDTNDQAPARQNMAQYSSPMTTHTFVMDGGRYHANPTVTVSPSSINASQNTTYSPLPLPRIRFDNRIEPARQRTCASDGTCLPSGNSHFLPPGRRPPSSYSSPPPISQTVDSHIRRSPLSPSPTTLPRRYRLPSQEVARLQMPRVDGVTMPVEVVENQPADTSRLLGSGQSKQPYIRQEKSPADVQHAELIAPFLLFPSMEEAQQ